MTEFDTSSPLLPQILSLHGKWKAGKAALISEEGTLSWSELDAASNQIAHGLIENGISKGDMVGIVMTNGPHMVEAILGVMKSGACSVPINLSVTDEALTSMLVDAKVKAVFTTEDQADRVILYKNQYPDTLHINTAASDSCTFDSFKANQPKSFPDIKIADTDPLNVIYSSGTTGIPKGILHTHKGRRDWAYDLAITLRYNSGARTLFTIGLYSNVSWVGFLATLLSGGTLVIHKQFDVQKTLETIEKQRITNMSMVPIQYQRLIEFPENINYDLSSIKAIMSCGSPLQADLRTKLFDRMGPVVIELFGLTEGVITTLDPEESEGRMASVGKPLIGTDIKIISDDGVEVQQGTSGEIVATGRIVMPGYLNNLEATKDATWIDASSKHWLRTGDIGYLDPEGYLYIVDRKKDMILSGGQNIYPQDIEAVLLKHDAVHDAAVIGVKSKKWGETPLAIVVLDKTVPVDIQTILVWTNKQLGKQQRITGIECAPEIPRNPNGKILKKDLREHYREIEFD